MKVDAQSLSNLGTGFKTSFQKGASSVTALYSSVATIIPSSTKSNTYGWLGDIPGMREWVGARVVHGLSTHSYTIDNNKYELTLGVDADDIADDNLGLYTPRFTAMGEAVASHPDELVFGMLKEGFSQTCYDGQNFFDDDHPITVDGEDAVYSNMQAGGNDAWYLLDTSRHLKPLIFQLRQTPEFKIKEDAATSDHVFNNDEYIYGAKGRYNGGYGFYQMAFASKAELSEANVKLARSTMTAQKNDEGRPLGIRPNLIVVGSSNEDKANDLINQERLANGSNNTLYKKFEVLVVPWLDQFPHSTKRQVQVLHVP